MRTDHSADQIVNGSREDDPSRFPVLLQSGRDVDAISIDVVCRRHHIANVYGDTQSDLAQLSVFGNLGALHSFLELARPLDSVERTRELGENAVSGRLDHPAVMSLGTRADYIGKQNHPAPMGARLVFGHQD